MKINSNLVSPPKTNSVSSTNNSSAVQAKQAASVTQKVMQSYVPSSTQPAVETRMSLSNNGNLIGTTISVKA